MYLEFGMAQKFIDDLGRNSQRGMRTKAEMGWYPAPAPMGYKNTPDKKKGFKIILEDDNTFPMVRRLFDEVLAGKQASQVYEEVSKTWMLTSKNKRIISRSAFYNILNKPFYYGEYEWPRGSGTWYKSQHKPMITREEFDRVQVFLGKMGKPVAHNHVFDLSGLFRCSRCGSAITATKKVKHYATTGNTGVYTYYHCTRKNKNIKCDARPLTEKDLIGQINSLLLLVKPEDEFIIWAKKWLSVVHKDQSVFHEDVLKSQQRELESIENRLNKLLDMRLNDLLSDDIYKTKKKELELEKRTIQEKLEDTNYSLDNGRLKVENALDFAYACQNKFETGLREIKQEILTRIGENLSINPDKLLDIKLKREFGVLADQPNWERRYKDWLEPQEYTDIMLKNKDLRPANPSWLPR